MLYSEKFRKFIDNQYYIYFIAINTFSIAEIAYFQFIFCIILIQGEFYDFFWQHHWIQRPILLRKPYFENFFRVNGRECVQIKVKNPKTAEYFKWKITWGIQNFDYLERLSEFDFHSNGILKGIFHFIMTYVQFFSHFFRT